LLNDTAEALNEVVEVQRDRRSWILEHWPHIIEYGEVTQTLDAGLWGPDVDTILDNLDPDPNSALADAIDAGEPWLRLAVGRLAAQWTHQLDTEAVDLLHDIADHRIRTGTTTTQPVVDAPFEADAYDERIELATRLDQLIDNNGPRDRVLIDPIDIA
jgi:hypothetical protein